MKKLLSITCTVAAFAVPAVAQGATQQERDAHKLAVKTCQGLHKTMKKADFKTMFGKNGVAHCVKQETAENTAEAQQAQETAHDNAATQCRTEQSDEDRQEDQNQVNAAKQCKAEQSDSNFSSSHDGKSFSDFYGTNKNHRNAFGKCVSKKAHEMNQQDQEGSGQQS